MAGLKDAKQIFAAKLRALGGSDNSWSSRSYQDAITALKWFDSEKDALYSSGKLQREIYGPVGMYMRVADPACALIIEKAVSVNRLLAFLVQTDSDQRLLSDQFKRLKIQIDVFTMKNLTLPPPPRMQAGDLARDFREIGMVGYLNDQVECPDIGEIRLVISSFEVEVSFNFELITFGMVSLKNSYFSCCDSSSISSALAKFTSDYVGSR